jgi:hypothetical protein
MVSILYKIFFINKEIMVRVQLPELAIYHIKMLVREVPTEMSISSILHIDHFMTNEATLKKAAAVAVEAK